jgi:hypothetical protein
MDLNNVRAEAEIEWCERVAASIEAGEGRHEGDPGGPFEADLEEWRKQQ